MLGIRCTSHGAASFFTKGFFLLEKYYDGWDEALIHNISFIMNQAIVDEFVENVHMDVMTPQYARAAVAGGIPVNARDTYGYTALQWAVYNNNRELVEVLLSVGADANAEDRRHWTSVWYGAVGGTADILQLLLHAGGRVDNTGTDSLLITMVRCAKDLECVSRDAIPRLRVLLACPELNLDVKHDGQSAEEWALKKGYRKVAAVIAHEQKRRARWTRLRAAWVAGIINPA